MTAQIAYLSSDNSVTLSGLRRSSDDAYVNDASVDLVLVDEDGDQVAGQTWPTSMIYVSGSDGDYRAVIESAVLVTKGLAYLAKITATGAGLLRYWEIPLVFAADDT